ncbi:hypothetical protein P171DRAFT_439055 [Karstenula rhodostoma CBS 690.94]|uniref:Uncharacterized protein n=1 Tax=Karstenula rhodostoma CBS 690.94 TaxID=1392251 RepID=A0A9P4UI91_9PLEO|nr:hypothetical protein P171DRAFT_439055 [Karstenula rhodostoma CBS 690.94]
MPWIEDAQYGRRRRYEVNDNLMRRHLPDIARDYTYNIKLDHLAVTLSRISSGRLPWDQALGPLQWFFNKASKSPQRELPPRVYNHLDDLIQRSSDMTKLRKHFTTLAYLCSRGSAPFISSHLTTFFERYAQDIIAQDHRHLSDWEHAIKQLIGLAPTTAALHELSRARTRRPRPRYQTHLQRSYSNYSGSDSGEDTYDTSSLHRGRRLNRAALPHYRARTLPPMFYPVPQVAAPNFLAVPASRGIMSGFPSPSLFAQDPWREAEMEEIRDHQAYLECAVEQLQLGQQELVEEVVQQVGGYGQLQIDY